MGCKLGNRTYDPSNAAINSHRPDLLAERQERLWRLHNIGPFPRNDGGQGRTICSPLAYAYSTAQTRERARGESLYFCTARRSLAHHSSRAFIQMEQLLSIKTPTSKSYFNAVWFWQIWKNAKCLASMLSCAWNQLSDNVGSLDVILTVSTTLFFVFPPIFREDNWLEDVFTDWRSV